MLPIYLIIAAVVMFALYLAAVYNGLIANRNQADEAWSDITVQLKRRYDLIPNLVETVKGYAKHEKSAFEDVTKARAAAMGAKTIDSKGTAEGELSQTLKSLFAVAEAYPELKANQNFMALQDELADTENKIQAARRFYNGNVRDLNIKIEVFPTNIFAGMLGFTSRKFFELDEQEAAAAKEPVAVTFDDAKGDSKEDSKEVTKADDAKADKK